MRNKQSVTVYVINDVIIVWVWPNMLNRWLSTNQVQSGRGLSCNQPITAFCDITNTISVTIGPKYV